MMTIAEQRQRVCATAKGWLHTPYHHLGRVKGVGCDCATFLAEVYEEAGVVERIQIDYYPIDWHMHRDAERYLDKVLHYCHRLQSHTDAQPGDIAMFRYGHTASHGAIILDWPRGIHSPLKFGRVSLCDFSSMLPRLVGVYRPNAWRIA